MIGTATIHTPVLKNPLTGPAYLVSHGNAAFPDVEFVLQGEGITLIVDGQTDIKNNVTYSKFETAPDAPFTSFETVLPAGPKSVLSVYDAANSEEPYSVCGTKLMMPTTIISQANKSIQTETPLTTTGCSGVKSNKTKKLSLHQRYLKALHACRTRYKHNKHKRARCETKAHHTYTDQSPHRLPPQTQQAQAQELRNHARSNTQRESAGAITTRIPRPESPRCPMRPTPTSMIASLARRTRPASRAAAILFSGTPGAGRHRLRRQRTAPPRT